MTVVMIISIMAAIAMPSMLRAKDDQRAYFDAQLIAQLFREARGRALGSGAAQVILFNVGGGGGQGDPGTFTWLSEVDRTGAEVGSCRQTNWQTLPDATAGNPGRRVQGVVDLKRDAQLGVQTAYLGGSGQANVTAICFTPAGRLFVSPDGLPGLSTGTPLLQPAAIEVKRAVDGATQGTVRSVVINPSGLTRVVSNQAS